MPLYLGKKRKASAPVASRSIPEVPSSSGSFVPCPTCGKSFSTAFVGGHAWECSSTSISTSTTLREKYHDAASDERRHKNPRRRPVALEGAFVACPACGISFPQHVIQEHAWGCTGCSDEERMLSSEIGNMSWCSSEESFGQLPGVVARETNPNIAAQCNANIAPEPDFSTVCWEERHEAVRAQNGNDRRPKLHDKGASAKPALSTAGHGLARETLKLKEISGGSNQRRREQSRRDLDQEDAIKKIMEGGKRAVRVEKQAKTVPRAWPVELVEDVLSTDQADKLLACLLEESKSWTFYPWFTNNGVEGRSHTRSRIYRLPNTNGDHCGPRHNHNSSSSSSSSSDSVNRIETNNSCDPCSSAATAATSSQCPTYGHPWTTANRGTATRNDLLTDEVDIYADGEIDQDGSDSDSSPRTSARISKAEVMIGKITQSAKPLNRMFDVRGRAAPRVRSPGRDCRLSAMAESALFDRSGSNHRQRLLLNVDHQHEQDLAPQELAEIVPKVVDLVRRRQRQRVDEGLGGEENLGWDPNFCICHVYDDHRSHIGPHCDTLSNIGPEAIVTGISLGAKRVFMVQEMLPWGTKGPPAGDWSGGGKKLLDMPHNSAVVMWGGCQERYKHSVPALPKGVGIHPIAGTRRISITLRERKETLPQYLLPIPECRCRAPAALRARVLANGGVEYMYQCDRGQGQCGFLVSKALARRHTNLAR